MLLHGFARKPKSQTTSERIEHERLTSLINSMADGVIAVDKQVNVVLCNGAALNILDRNDPIDHKPLHEIFQPIDKENKGINVTKLVQSAHTSMTDRDMRLRYADGSCINLYTSIAPVHLGYGERGEQGYVVLLRDITHEKSLEEERDEFISVASHELRTPIAITEGNISNAQFIVEKSGDMTKVKQALEEAHNQVLFLADLVNDLSTLSRAERGKLPLDIAPINISELVAELQHNYQAQATAKGLTLQTDVQTAAELKSSKLYVRETLQNFITNALKYTEKGHVTISAKDAEDGILFAVSDTGIGITHSDQKRVFEKFFRSEDYRTRKTNGTGLGLYVTAKLAKLLGAKITMESELNKGSTFSIFVPNLPGQPKRAAPVAA